MSHQAHPDHDEDLHKWISDILKIEIQKPLFPNLKDGVVLHKLADHFNQTSTKPEDPVNIFKKNINITYFINTCSKMGVNVSELFDTVDLNEERYSFVKRCLDSFSRHLYKKNLVSTCTGPKLSEQKTFNYDKDLIVKKRLESFKDRGVDFGSYYAHDGVRRQITKQDSKDDCKNPKDGF